MNQPTFRLPTPAAQVRWTYHIFADDSKDVFEAVITARLNDGWELVGGLAMTGHGQHERKRYHQAMRKSESLLRSNPIIDEDL